MPPFVPNSIAAIESGRISVLYYARPDGDLASLTAQKPGEDPSYPPYKAANIILDGNTVSAAVPQVTAVAYTLYNKREIRLYFIGGHSGNNYIRELCKTENGEWTEGTLTTNRFDITTDSLISANVENDVGDLKIFYNNRDDDGVTVPFVAWVGIGQTSWSQRPIGKWR